MNYIFLLATLCSMSACQPISSDPDDSAPTTNFLETEVSYSDVEEPDDTESVRETAGAREQAASPKGKVYIQYASTAVGSRELQGVFTLKDYYFTTPPDNRTVWAMASNPNYVDTVKMAALIAAKTVKLTLLKHKGVSPVKLRSLAIGYHVLSDGGPNPQVISVNSTDKPLLWFNSNYAQTVDHAIVRLVLKNYPAGHKLKWWFMGSDVLGEAMTAAELTSAISSDDDLTDYDAIFSDMQPGKGRSFRAPKGTGYLITKTPLGGYQVAKLNVGLKKSTTVTFNLPAVAN
ncbi:hypothetical protein [Spirosoma sordidisoli]|uniref:Uncharacterized protein n=1 Tax=Spirosoma sordidisoli TaxID=2502893 RepID=A0A4Q2UQL1_9BACT|nr:hypothetical protein [Spirosoma sordidisoli]RYC70091.1 hypothetical protein EQG79_09475 [Spirosoma sordidisoli]